MAWIKLTKSSSNSEVYVNTLNIIEIETYKEFARLKFNCRSGTGTSGGPYALQVKESLAEVMLAIGQSKDNEIVRGKRS